MAARKENNLNRKNTKKNQPRILPYTDTGNMERFIRDHRHVIKSGGHDRQWYIWTGQRWEPSHRDAAFNLALETVENLGLEASRSSTPSEAEELRRWHKTSWTIFVTVLYRRIFPTCQRLGELQNAGPAKA